MVDYFIASFTGNSFLGSYVEPSDWWNCYYMSNTNSNSKNAHKEVILWAMIYT